MTAFDRDDIAAMRAEGSLREFLHVLTGRVPKQPTPAASAPEPDLDIPRPGAWPTRTQPPASIEPWTPAAIQHALDDYRAWLLADQPLWDATCHCPNCLPNGDA